MGIAHCILYTSRFIDVHSLGAYSDEEQKKFQESPMDEYGVKVLNIFYNISSVVVMRNLYHKVRKFVTSLLMERELQKTE